MKRLCKLQDLPRHLQFNEFILTGYRPPSHFSDCLKSTLQLHNESFNILSHVFTLLYFLARIGDYTTTWNSGDRTVKLFIVVDLLCTTVPFALSVIYHTFMPHMSGPRVYTPLLKADVFGVWFATTFGALSALYVTLHCMPMLLRGYLVLYILLSLVVLYYLIVVDCKRKRFVALTVQFLFRSLVHLCRLTPLVTVPVTAFQYYLVMNAISSVGALINALRIPERLFPGGCDYVLNGHSLMHVAAFLSVFVGRYGLLIDLKWLTSDATCPDAWQ